MALADGFGGRAAPVLDERTDCRETLLLDVRVDLLDGRVDCRGLELEGRVDGRVTPDGRVRGADASVLRAGSGDTDGFVARRSGWEGAGWLLCGAWRGVDDAMRPVAGFSPLLRPRNLIAGLEFDGLIAVGATSECLPARDWLGRMALS